MASIAAALDRIKLDPLGALGRDAVEEVCQELGYVGWRQRELDPATTLALFVQQVIHGNAPEVRHIAGKDFSASAWCQARSRLPLSVYQSMLTLRPIGWRTFAPRSNPPPKATVTPTR